LTGNITVRIAARPATCARWIAVTADPARIELQVSDDERLLGAVGSAGAFIALRAGLKSAAQAEVAAAAEEACRATFPLLSCDNAKVDVTVEQFLDRIEVTLAYRGAPQPTSAPEKFGRARGALAIGAGRIELLSKVDRVQHTTEGGISKTTLVKNLHADPT
jgi:hypothetical protein